MLSGKLIHLIEVHHQDISDRIIREIWRHPDLVHLRRLPEAELRERGQNLLENLGYWLASGNEDELVRVHEAVGKRRFEQSIPLYEVVRALCVIKENMVDFIEEQGIPKDSLGLYAEEEMEHRIGRFFDTLIVYTVRGYETAWHRAAHATAQTA
jgi:hypothetical protein